MSESTFHYLFKLLPYVFMIGLIFQTQAHKRLALHLKYGSTLILQLKAIFLALIPAIATEIILSINAPDSEPVEWAKVVIWATWIPAASWLLIKTARRDGKDIGWKAAGMVSLATMLWCFIIWMGISLIALICLQVLFKA